MTLRDEIVAFMREYYDAGHIVCLNTDVMAHKLADRIEPMLSFSERAIKEVYTYRDLVRVILEVASIGIEPGGLSICVHPHQALAPQSALTPEQLADAISITHNMVQSTAQTSPRFDDICQHLADLLNIQKERSKK